MLRGSHRGRLASDNRTQAVARGKTNESLGGDISRWREAPFSVIYLGIGSVCPRLEATYSLTPERSAAMALSHRIFGKGQSWV